MTSAAGIVAPASTPVVMKPSAPPPSKLPNVARPKKGKTSVKNNKAAGGSGTSKASRKKLAGRVRGEAATEAPASSLVEPAADAHIVFDDMPQSVNDDAYMSTMGVGSNNSHWSQTNDMHFKDHEFEVDEDGEGIVGTPKGRGCNYTNIEDVVLCETWLDVSRDPSVGGDQSRDAYWLRMKEHFDLRNVSGIDRSARSLRSRWSTINKDCQQWAAAQKAVDKLNPSGTNDDDRLNIAQNLFKGEEKRTKKGKINKGSPFTLPHCYNVLQDDEKWKKREDIDDFDLSKKRKRTIDLEDDDEEDASSEEGKISPTPNSVSYSKPKRPDGTKKDAKEKKRRKGDDELKYDMEAIVNARKEANEERRLASEERRVAVEERKVALEERKVGMEERSKLLEWEKHLFFLDTSLFNDAQKEYVNLAREYVLIQKRTMIRAMGGGGLGGMGGIGAMGGFGATMGGMGSMGGFGATMETMGGMGGFGPPPGGLDGMGGMGGMSFASLISGMGPPPDAGVPPSHDLGNTFRASRDEDAARNNGEEEEESSSAESDESDEDEDVDEDEA
ncbi:Alternative oxidase 1a, mitochondrial [Hordeum vulgare]|nr:Alternative oxidase 1a, mitochondrial [Hordeum vulgare]